MRIYLDHCATTPLGEAARQALLESAARPWANPASQHEEGRSARRQLASLTAALSELLGVRTGREGDRFLWTSGGTESNNLAILGLCDPTAGGLIVSAVEHPSVRQTADRLARQGVQVRVLPVDGQGVTDPERLRQWLAQAPASLVSVMLVNHETGAIQPIAELAEICREYNARLHADAVQAAGKIPLDFAALGVDAMSVTAHKLHGPVGVGGLAVRSGVVPQPQLTGGFQQGGIRPGTESPLLPAGFLAALRAALTDDAGDILRRLQQRFEAVLLAELPEAVIHSGLARRAPHVSNVSFPGLDRQALVMALDLAGVACSTGSACASGSSEPSPVLLAMGVPDRLIGGALRFSFGAEQSLEDIEEAARRVGRTVRKQLG